MKSDIFYQNDNYLEIKTVNNPFKMESSRLILFQQTLKFVLKDFSRVIFHRGQGVNPSPLRHVIDIEGKPEAQHRTRGGGGSETIRKNFKILSKFSVTWQK